MQAKESRNFLGWISRSGDKASGETRSKQVRGVTKLWDQEFNLVKEGLEETQVIAYVEELKIHHGEAMEKLQRPRPLSELAGKVIYEAEKLAETIEEEERKRTAQRSAEIILRTEERSKEITDEAEIAAALRLQEATRLSAEIVVEARKKTTLAEEKARLQVPQQILNIQVALQAAIDQEYQKVYADLMDLEREIQARGVEERSQTSDVSQVEIATAESRPETVEEETRTADVSLVKVAPVEPEAEVAEDESEVPGSAITAPTSEELQASTGEDETLSPARNGLPESSDGTVEEEDYSNLSREDVREKIRESLQQSIELSGYGQDTEVNEDEPKDEEPVSPDQELENVATNGNGDITKMSSDVFQGDLEFVMAPQKNGQEGQNRLGRLSALYMTVKKTPGASVLGTGGSEAEGNSIAVHFENPVHLNEVLKDVMMWEEERHGNGAIISRNLLGRLKSNNGLDEPTLKRILVTL